MPIGLESGSDRMLKLIDKRFTVERMLEGVREYRQIWFSCQLFFYCRFSHGNEEDFEDTIKLMYRVYKIHPQAGFTLGAYLPYPGSKIYDFSLTQGFMPPEKTEDWGKIDRFRKDFKSPWVDVKKVWVIRECFKILSWDFVPFKKWFGLRIRHNFYSFP